MTFPHFVWTNTGNYPAGSNPWNGQPLALSPAQTYFTPTLKPSPEEFNYILGQMTTELEYLFANTPTVKTATYGIYFPAGTLAVTNGLATVVGTSTTFGTDVFVGTALVIASVDYIVASIADATHLTLTANYTGTTASGLSPTTNGGIWTAPTGVTSVDVDCVGGGGGGGGGSSGENTTGLASSGGGGGAGAQCASQIGVPVVPGQVYAAEPGAGGAAGTGGTAPASDGTNGGDGGDSTFGIVLSPPLVTGKGAQGGTGGGGLNNPQYGTPSTTAITPGGSGPAGSYNLPAFAIATLNSGFTLMRNPSEGGAGTGDALLGLGLTFKGNLSTLGGTAGTAGLTGNNASGGYGGGGSGGGGGAGPGATRAFESGTAGNGGAGGNAVTSGTGHPGNGGGNGGPGCGGGGGGGGGAGTGSHSVGGLGGLGGTGWITLKWVEFDSNPIG